MYQQATLATASADSAITVTGLRLAPTAAAPTLHALLLPGGPAAASQATATLSSPAATELDFDLTYDGASASWSVRVALPEGRAAAHVEVWCRECRVQGAAGALTGLLSSQALQQSPDAAVVALVLEGAALPAAAESTDGSSSGSRRRLQASNCALSVAGTTHTFGACTSIAPSGGCSMDIYASVAASGAGSVLTLGIAAVTLGGWASVGLPSTPGQMLGASAVIVWPTTGIGANVTGTKLESLEEQPVNAAMGNFAVSNAVAEYVGGKLYAVFSIALPSQSAASVASKPTNLIYAIGPMGSAYSPGIGDHTGEGQLRPYSVMVLSRLALKHLADFLRILSFPCRWQISIRRSHPASQAGAC